MDDFTRKLGACLISALVGGVAVGGIVNSSNKVEISELSNQISSLGNSLELKEDALTSANLQIEELTNAPEPEPEVIEKVTIDGVEYDKDAVEELLSKLDLELIDYSEMHPDYMDAIEELDDKFASIGEVERFVESDEDDSTEFKEDLLVELNANGWDIEDIEDFVYIKILDDEANVDIERNDDDEIEGTIEVEIKSKFYDGGVDGDRHRDSVNVEFELKDGEVFDWEFI
jgi:hypothetical protein